MQTNLKFFHHTLSFKSWQSSPGSVWIRSSDKAQCDGEQKNSLAQFRAHLH